MKKFILCFFSLFFISLSTQAMTVVEGYKKLQSYSYKDLEVTKDQSEKVVGQKTSEMLNTIDQCVALVMKEKGNVPAEFMEEMVRVAVLTFQNDPLESSGELLVPLYKQYKPLLEKAIDHLPKKSAKDLRERIEGAIYEEIHGNG